jgi:hypothetical protein
MLSLHYPNTKTTDKMHHEPTPGPGVAAPARLYTVTSTMPGTGGTFARFADACRCLAALRHNQPHFTHSLLDPDGYIVPSTEILKGLAIVRGEAESHIAYVRTYEAVIAPAYETTPDMPAQEIAEQAIKEAREQRPDMPAFTCYTTTIPGPLPGSTQTWVRGEVGTTATVQPALLRFLKACKKEGSRWVDSRDFSEPTPAGCIEVCLWLMWGTAIHLQRRIFITSPVGEGPADEPAPTAGAPEQPAAIGFEGWQRSALIDMAAGPDTPADVLQLLEQCTDEQLVLAAGFQVHRPQVRAAWLPVLMPEAAAD